MHKHIIGLYSKVSLVKDDALAVIFAVGLGPWLDLTFGCSFETTGMWDGIGTRKSLAAAIASKNASQLTDHFGVDISVSADWVVIAQVGIAMTSDNRDLSGFAYQLPPPVWCEVLEAMKQLLA